MLRRKDSVQTHTQPGLIRLGRLKTDYRQVYFIYDEKFQSTKHCQCMNMVNNINDGRSTVPLILPFLGSYSRKDVHM